MREAAASRLRSTLEFALAVPGVTPECDAAALRAWVPWGGARRRLEAAPRQP
jgi:hypothetical protein